MEKPIPPALEPQPSIVHSATMNEAVPMPTQKPAVSPPETMPSSAPVVSPPLASISPSASEAQPLKIPTSISKLSPAALKAREVRLSQHIADTKLHMARYKAATTPAEKSSILAILRECTRCAVSYFLPSFEAFKLPLSSHSLKPSPILIICAITMLLSHTVPLEHMKRPKRLNSLSNHIRHSRHRNRYNTPDLSELSLGNDRIPLASSQEDDFPKWTSVLDRSTSGTPTPTPKTSMTEINHSNKKNTFYQNAR